MKRHNLINYQKKLYRAPQISIFSPVFKASPQSCSVLACCQKTIYGFSSFLGSLTGSEHSLLLNDDCSYWTFKKTTNNKRMTVKIILSHKHLVFQEAPLLCLSFSQQTLHLLQLGHIWSAGTADETTKTDTLESESLQTSPCFFSGGTFAENLISVLWGSMKWYFYFTFFGARSRAQNGLFTIPAKRLYSPEYTADYSLFMRVCVCWIRGNPLGKWANLSIWTCFFPLCPSPSTVCSYSSLP